jgi:hypothetical protein
MTAAFVGGRGFSFEHPVQLAGWAGLFASGLVTVKYFLIFSRRFGPIPRMAIRSFTLLNDP